MIGQTIAHYRVLEQLGQGGMGIVYKAEDTRLRRIVALKFLPESLRRDTSAREQFLREARAASQLKHPNVLTIYTVEESEEGDFIAMEFAEGGTLRERIGSLTIPQIVAFMTQAASGLQAAHDRGIIHRDIKPDNLLIDAEGRLRISDFGLARVASEDSGAVHSDVAVGTAHYMSPEQVTGARIDARSDIFSLGVAFFELAAKRRPFEGDYVMSVLYAIANDPAPALSEFDPSIPSGFENVIARCLAKSPEDRHASCRQLAEELAELQGGGASPRMHGPVAAVPSAIDTRPLIGRKAELESFERRLRDAISGKGHSVFLTGESGVGKTRLAEAVMACGRELGMGVLAGRCLPQGGGLPFHPYANALRNGLPRLNEALVGSLERRAAGLGIDLRNRLPVLKSFLNMSGPTAVINQEQLWDSLLVLLRVISAERPVILFLDDLQWADEDTLRFFGFIARSAADLPLMQMATFRAIESTEALPSATQGLTGLVRQLHGDGFADILDVKRLTTNDTLSLASELLGWPIEDSELAQTIARRTDGNPLFVRELVELIRDADQRVTTQSGIDALVPGRVRDIISQRIEKLTAADRDLLELAACETEFFDSDILLECLGGERIPLLRNLQRLENVNRLIRHDGPRYRFDHPLLREVIYEGVLPELRTEYHRLIAKALTGRHKDSVEHASRIAHHMLASSQRHESMGYLLRAAERARDLCANSEALRLYLELESILAAEGRITPDDEMRFKMGLGDVLLAKGKTAEAHSRFEDGLRIARTLNTPSVAMDFLRRLSTSYRILGNLDRARDVAQAAVDEARSIDDHSRLIECLLSLAMVHVPRAEYDRTVEIAHEALQKAEQANDHHHQSIAQSILGAAQLHRGEYRRSSESLERAIEMQRSFGDQRGLASTLNFSGLAYNRLAKFSQSIAHHEESLRIKRAIQDVSAIPGGLNALGDVFRDVGQLDLAIKNHTESLKMARLHANRGAECDNLRDLAVDHTLMGDFDAAELSVEQVLRLAQEYKYPWYETRACSAFSELLRLRGDIGRADEYSARALDLARHINATELLAEALLARARVIAATKQNVNMAIDHVRQGIVLAESDDLILPLRMMYLVLAQLLRAAGDPIGANSAHDKAQHYLHVAAESIDDPTMRQSFLETPLALSILASAS
jgi:tetratricopeptide (TPR) repeat protein/tRNA A-37 threonylcarbamoyl transferase component Bud32